MFKLDSPNPGWANPNDCGTYTCTGLYNVLIEMEQIYYVGTPRVFGFPTSFQVTANNLESVSAQVTKGCEPRFEWNAYLCTNRDLGVMLFESEDYDRMDRSAQPIYYWDHERGFDNRLNAYMDVCWNGAYTCQKREQRFPAFIDISRNYTIEYTGTPPQNQKFELYGPAHTKGCLITIRYVDAGSYKVYTRDRELAIPTDWDYEIETWEIPPGRYCGENRYVGVRNFLQFWIEPGCLLYIRPRDAIMLAIRLEWTVKEFFEEDGVGIFSDRMAAALGIHGADVKVVQVYEGSAIVEFEIIADEEEENPVESLKAIE